MSGCRSASGLAISAFPPIAPQFLRRVGGEEVGKRFPLVGEIDLVADGDDLTIAGLESDNRTAKSLLCLSDALACAHLLKDMLEIWHGTSRLSCGRPAGTGMAFLIF